MPIDKDTKTHALNEYQFDLRVKQGFCPVCSQHRNKLVMLHKRPGMVHQDKATGHVKLSGWFWECSEHGWQHYQLSPGGGKAKPRETSDVVPPPEAENTERARPHKRVKGALRWTT